MRLLEVLKTIRNKFIRKNPQTQPEDDQRVPVEIKALEKEKTTAADSTQTHRIEDEKERLIRRYRAYDYCHKKRRIRKKYLKKLIEISPIDRFLYCIRQCGVSAYTLERGLYWGGIDYSTHEDFTRWTYRHMDHPDSRIEGGVR